MVFFKKKSKKNNRLSLKKTNLIFFFLNNFFGHGKSREENNRAYNRLSLEVILSEILSMKPMGYLVFTVQRLTDH